MVYWKNLAGHFVKEEDQEIVLPELSNFCKYIRAFTLDRKENAENHQEEDDDDDRKIKWTFISRQLILMLDYFDLSHEAGGANLYTLLNGFL